ncbi:MAG: VOC family protein, partial [Clostridia bacterium]
GGQFLEFFYGRDAKQDRQGEGFFESFSKSDPFQHLCLQVDDAEKTCAALMAQGISIGVMPQQGQDHNIQFWVKDPDGMPIEFMQISADSPQAKA